ncbi:HEPN domain-containing protein [Candidatus Micrarchaeota archaeon]|nr:HEPN domain-containing protein [Candidatus Micrarchaeota archaeon]
MKEDVSLWLKQSEADLDSAESLLEIKKYYASAFFSQQSTEKILKAACIKKFNELIKIHDLVFLARKLNAPEDIVNNCRYLNNVYIESRYPREIYAPAEIFSDEDAKKAIKLAKEVIKWAKKNL